MTAHTETLGHNGSTSTWFLLYRIFNNSGELEVTASWLKSTANPKGQKSLCFTYAIPPHSFVGYSAVGTLPGTCLLLSPVCCGDAEGADMALGLSLRSAFPMCHFMAQKAPSLWFNLCLWQHSRPRQTAQDRQQKDTWLPNSSRHRSQPPTPGFTCLPPTSTHKHRNPSQATFCPCSITVPNHSAPHFFSHSETFILKYSR